MKSCHCSFQPLAVSCWRPRTTAMGSTECNSLFPDWCNTRFRPCWTGRWCTWKYRSQQTLAGADGDAGVAGDGDGVAVAAAGAVGAV